MKRVVLAILFVLIPSVAVTGVQTYSACGAPVIRTPGQKVLCCCNTFQGQCCGYVTFCGSFIPGCFGCTGHSVEAE